VRLIVTEKNQPSRIPPGQQLVAPGKWPIIGERQPAESAQPWCLEIVGKVEHPVKFSLDQLCSLPQSERVLDIHCVTRWSMLDVPVKGVLLAELLASAGAHDEARFISFQSRSERSHSTSLPLDIALGLETMIALEMSGQPISSEHGGPIRNIVPGRYFYKSVKWLTRIELLVKDRLGYWEAETGYHNNADPWKQERYMVPNLDRRTVSRLLESKDFSGHDLRSIDASDRILDGLCARQALLRDANFRQASLVAADFSGANLSNAHLGFAKLNRAKFIGTDLEGADLSGADLSGADLTGCSLIGSSFCESDENGRTFNGATFDSQTILPNQILTPLTPIQLDYVQSQLDSSKRKSS
jgi:DMSO/TMAO reductase YedYZ molybdopterin-dependent catalytic subunit